MLFVLSMRSDRRASFRGPPPLSTPSSTASPSPVAETRQTGGREPASPLSPSSVMSSPTSPILEQDSTQLPRDTSPSVPKVSTSKAVASMTSAPVAPSPVAPAHVEAGPRPAVRFEPVLLPTDPVVSKHGAKSTPPASVPVRDVEVALPAIATTKSATVTTPATSAPSTSPALAVGTTNDVGSTDSVVFRHPAPALGPSDSSVCLLCVPFTASGLVCRGEYLACY